VEEGGNGFFVLNPEKRIEGKLTASARGELSNTILTAGEHG
jgi:hypothetical protein